MSGSTGRGRSARSARRRAGRPRSAIAPPRSVCPTAGPMRPRATRTRRRRPIRGWVRSGPTASRTTTATRRRRRPCWPPRRRTASPATGAPIGCGSPVPSSTPSPMAASGSTSTLRRTTSPAAGGGATRRPAGAIWRSCIGPRPARTSGTSSRSSRTRTRSRTTAACRRAATGATTASCTSSIHPSPSPTCRPIRWRRPRRPCDSPSSRARPCRPRCGSGWRP